MAEEEGKSRVEVIEEALEVRMIEAMLPRFKAIGVIDGGPTDISQNVDRYLEGLGED